MTAAIIRRPAPAEYAAYYEGYVSLVEAGADVVETLRRQLGDTLALLRGLDEAHGDSRYAPGKWSIKEVVGHVIDAERVFAYRALAFARGETQPQPGYDQDDYLNRANFGARTLRDLADELAHVRASTLDLFRHLDPDAWARRGVANENEVSVRALAYIIAGHETHHTRIIRTRYLTNEEGATQVNDNEEQSSKDFNNAEQTTEPPTSPSEKLEGDQTPPGTLTPGAQNPESTEIKKEVNPNSE